MTHTFDSTYWEDHWRRAAPGPARHGPDDAAPANPYLAVETADLPGGTALDAGCGRGAEVRWLAEHGWQVTGADISPTALAVAAHALDDAHLADRVELVQVDVSRWAPGRVWDLVVTSYAHPDSGQLPFYARIASWVAPGGTVLVVAHDHGRGDAHDHEHPPGSTAYLPEITALFGAPAWRVDSAYATTRTVRPDGRPVQLRDVVVRAHRIR